jgi:hypothetical protein
VEATDIQAVRKMVRRILKKNEPLEVWFSVRNQHTGTVLYEACATRDLRCGDTASIEHIIGTVVVTDA